MTIAFGDAYPGESMHALLLRFIGSFAHVQHTIDQLVAETYFAKRTPKVAEFVMSRWVSRIYDEDRPKLLRAIADDVASDAELENFAPTYTHVGRVRNRAAHSSVFLENDADTLAVRKTNLRRHEEVPGSSTVTMARVEIHASLRKCAWLEAQAIYIIASAPGLSEAIYLGEVPYEAVKPAAHPDDWDGVTFRPTTTSN